MLREYRLQQRGVTRITEHEIARCDCSFKPGRQIIQRNDVFARKAQLPDDVAANVSGSASNKYLIVFHRIIFSLWRFLRKL